MSRHSWILFLAIFPILAGPAEGLPETPSTLDPESAARFAFTRAYEEVKAANPGEIHAGLYFILSNDLSAFDKEKARELLHTADVIMAEEIRKWEKRQEGIAEEIREWEKRQEGKEDKSRSPGEGNWKCRSYLSAGLMSLDVDREFARKYFKLAEDSATGKDANSLFDKAKAEIGILFLEGKRKKLINKALGFCRRHPTIRSVGGFCGTPMPTNRSMAWFLKRLDPELAVEFASHYDSPFYTRTLAEAAKIVSHEKPQLAGEYYLEMAELALKKKRSGVGQRTFETAMAYLSAQDFDAAIKLFGSKKLSGYTRKAFDGLLGVLARKDMNAAIEIVKKRPSGDGKRLMVLVAENAVQTEPDLMEEALSLVGPHNHAQVYKAAAIGKSKLGDLDGAVKLLEKIKSDAARGDGLVRIAEVGAEEDEEIAISLLEQAFQLRSNSRSFWEMAQIARRVYEIDEARGLLLFKKGLESTLEKRDQDSKWRQYCAFAGTLVEVDAESGVDALKKVPEPKAGSPGNEVDVFGADLLPRIALVDPRFAISALEDMLERKRHQNNLSNLQGMILDVALAIAQHDEKKAYGVVDLIRDRYEGDESRKYLRYRDRIRKNLTCELVKRRIVKDPDRADEYLEILDTNLGENIDRHRLITSAAIEIARKDWGKVAKFIGGLENGNIKESCLNRVFRERLGDIEEAREIIGSLSPAARVRVWMTIGRSFAGDIPRQMHK